jgi:hypothetical protein
MGHQEKGRQGKLVRMFGSKAWPASGNGPFQVFIRCHTALFEQENTKGLLKQRACNPFSSLTFPHAVHTSFFYGI